MIGVLATVCGGLLIALILGGAHVPGKLSDVEHATNLNSMAINVNCEKIRLLEKRIDDEAKIARSERAELRTLNLEILKELKK